MIIYVVTKDGVVMHITTDFDEAEIVATGYVACARDQVLEKRRVANEIVFNGGEIDMAEAALLAGWGTAWRFMRRTLTMLFWKWVRVLSLQ